MERTPKRYGTRISILGLWQLTVGFEYALPQGGFKGKSSIEVMDWIATKAAQTLEQPGRSPVFPIIHHHGSGNRDRAECCSVNGAITRRSD